MNPKTRLSEALAAHPSILEYIISLNPHDFERLRNPILRKVMPPRITVGRVAAIAGVPAPEVLAKIHELAGLPAYDGDNEIDLSLPQSSAEQPEWMNGVDLTQIKWVDLAPIDEALGDPMPPINIAVNTSKPGDVIGIIHKWEPQPLYDIWESRGLDFWAQQIEPDVWHIFVHRPKEA